MGARFDDLQSRVAGTEAKTQETDTEIIREIAKGVVVSAETKITQSALLEQDVSGGFSSFGAVAIPELRTNKLTNAYPDLDAWTAEAFNYGTELYKVGNDKANILFAFSLLRDENAGFLLNNPLPVLSLHYEGNLDVDRHRLNFGVLAIGDPANVSDNDITARIGQPLETKL